MSGIPVGYRPNSLKFAQTSDGSKLQYGNYHTQWFVSPPQRLWGTPWDLRDVEENQILCGGERAAVCCQSLHMLPCLLATFHLLSCTPHHPHGAHSKKKKNGEKNLNFSLNCSLWAGYWIATSTLKCNLGVLSVYNLKTCTIIWIGRKAKD